MKVKKRRRDNNNRPSYSRNSIKQEQAAKPIRLDSTDHLFPLDEEKSEDSVSSVNKSTELPGDNERLVKSVNLPANGFDDLELLQKTSKRSLPSIHRLKNQGNAYRETTQSLTNIPKINEPNESSSVESKRKSLNLTDTNVKSTTVNNNNNNNQNLTPEPKMKRSFASKDDLTLHWEQGEKKQKEDEDNTISDKNKKNEQPEEEKQEEEQMVYPTGVFKDHLSITGSPAVSARFPKVTCKQIYAKLFNCKPFWEYVFEKQENKNGSITDLRPSKSAPTAMFERDMTFVTPIKNAPMGPKETRVEQDQRISMPTPK